MERVGKDKSLQIPSNYFYKKIETVLWDKKTRCAYNINYFLFDCHFQQVHVANFMTQVDNLARQGFVLKLIFNRYSVKYNNIEVIQLCTLVMFL